MFCSRCGTLLHADDRFCPRCGAAAPPAEHAGAEYIGPEYTGPEHTNPEHAGPEHPGPEPAGRRGRVVNLVIVTLLVLLAILLAFAGWKQWEALRRLFRQAPADPGPVPFSQSDPQPERDAAGSLRLLPADPFLERLPQAARETAEEAAQNALQAIWGSVPMTGETALELFCNLSEGGYVSGQALADHLNETCTGTLNQWNGRIAGQPLIQGNRAYMDVMLYAVRGTGGAPYSFDYDILTDEVLICMIWSGSEWLVDASTMAEFMLQDDYRFLCSDGFCEARAAGRACFFFLGPSMMVEPVIPQVCDTLIREVYATPDGGAVISCWAYNGLGEPVDLEALDEVYLVRPDSYDYYFHEYGRPIEPLHLEPREGRVLTITIPPEDMLVPLEDATSLTARARLIGYR